MLSSHLSADGNDTLQLRSQMAKTGTHIGTFVMSVCFNFELVFTSMSHPTANRSPNRRRQNSDKPTLTATHLFLPSHISTRVLVTIAKQT